MWSSLLVGNSGTEPVIFSGVGVIPAGDPQALIAALQQWGGSHTLVAAPRVLADDLRTALTLAAGRHPDLALTWMVSDHAPIALLGVLALARSVTTEPAVGVDLVHRSLGMSWSGAWAASVTKLDRPTPRFSQHLRSMLPGSGFLVRQAPQPAVLRASEAGHDVVLPVGAPRVLLAEDGAVPAALTQALAASDHVASVRQVALPGVWTSIYGTDRTGQVALLPADLKTLLTPPVQDCPACSLPLPGPVCPYCRVVAEPAAVPVRSGGVR